METFVANEVHQQFANLMGDCHEIIKIILSQLNHEDLLNAMRVCTLWMKIGLSIFRNDRCLRYLTICPMLTESKFGREDISCFMKQSSSEILEKFIDNIGKPCYLIGVLSEEWFMRKDIITKYLKNSTTLLELLKNALPLNCEILLLESEGITGTVQHDLRSNFKGIDNGNKGVEISNSSSHTHESNLSKEPLLHSNPGYSVEIEDYAYPEINETFIPKCLMLLSIPSQPGVKFNMITMNEKKFKQLHPNNKMEDILDITDDEFNSICSLRNGEDLKALLIFGVDTFTDLGSAFIKAAAKRQNYRIALGGGIVNEVDYKKICNSSFCDKPEFVALCLSGPNVRAASLIISRSVLKISDLKIELRKLKSYGLPESNSMCFIFACCGRGHSLYSRREPIDGYNVETRTFRELFPFTPVFGIFGQGEAGLNFDGGHHRDVEESKLKKRRPRFYDCGWADDGTGLEVVVEPWIDNLFAQIVLSVKSLNLDQYSLNSEIAFLGNANVDGTSNIVGTVYEVMSRKPYSEILERFSNLDLLGEEEVEKHAFRILKFDQNKKLTQPIKPSSYIVLDIHEKDEFNRTEPDNYTLEAEYPFAASAVMSCEISSCQRLTNESSVKRSLEVELSLLEGMENFKYEPGDSIGIIVKNPPEEVDLLLTLLNLEFNSEKLCSLSLDPDTKKRTSTIPKYIPKSFSLRYLFSNCLDIRAIPKKRFIQSLVEYTSDPFEKRRLEELCCKEGNEEFSIIRRDSITFLDFLILFQSCVPPVSILVEHLPRLLPRPYSLTSTPLGSSKKVSFVFNVIEIPKGEGITFSRKGICTGWIEEQTKFIQKNKKSLNFQLENPSLEDSLKDLKLKSTCINLYFRSNQTFRLPSNPEIPIIMVGPGTGVAPYIGFLKHRQCLSKFDKRASKTKNENDCEIVCGPSYLFFGCRHNSKDFIYRDELKSFCDNGTLTKLFTSFSRDSDSSTKYVQHNITKNGYEISKLIKDNASIYVCGDATNMSKNVFEAFTYIIQNNYDYSIEDAKKFMAQLQINGRYLQDVWSS